MRPEAWRAAGTGVCLAAFALRAYLLDGQSLWYDEGISATMASRDFAAITSAASADIHPPLYYYLLHLWTTIAGSAEYALRFPSVMTGTLLVSLLAVVGRRLFGPWVGLLAGWLAATAPLLIHYSQEARMYALLLLLTTLAVYLALCLSEARRPGPWAVGLSVTTALSLYTHYLAAGPLVVAALLLLGQRIGRPFLWKGWLWWGTALGVGVLAWAPWAVLSLGQVVGRTGPAMGEEVPVADFLARVLAVFAYGLSFDATLTPRAWGLVLALAVAPLVWGALQLSTGLRPPSFRWWRGGQRDEATMLVTLSEAKSPGLVLLWLALPVLATYALWLWRPLYNPVINPRFALPAAPAFYLWLALGLVAATAVAYALRERLLPPRGVSRSAVPVIVGLTCLALLYFTGRSLAAYYFDPKYARDDYRGLAHHLEASSAPRDAIILNAPGQAEVFGYYYRGSAAVYPLPRQRPVDKGHTITELEAIGRAHSRVWLVLWADDESDPAGVVEGWLRHEGRAFEERGFGTVRLQLYDVTRRP